MKSIRALLIVASLLAVLTGQSAASSTGNLTGIVTDSIVGNPAAGVNVRIEGTAYESMTGEDGTYEVQNVAPGVYRIVFEIHPERRAIVEQVMVISGRVTSLSVEIGIAESVLPSPDIPLLTGSGRALRRSDLDALPATNLVDVLAQSSPSVHTRGERASYVRNSREWYGIASSEFTNVNGWDNLYVRGGDEFELGYRINGWSLQDPFTGEWLARLPMAAVSGITLRTSDIRADVGNFSSGVVDVYGAQPTSTFQTAVLAQTDGAASSLGAASFGRGYYSAISSGPAWNDRIGYAVAVDWLNAEDLEPGIYGSPRYRIVGRSYYVHPWDRDSVVFEGTSSRKGARDHGVNSGDGVNAYGVLVYRPAKRVRLEAMGLYSLIDRNIFFDSWVTAPDHVPHSRRSTMFAGVSGQYDPNENITVNARIGYYGMKYEIADRAYFDDIQKDLGILQMWDSARESTDVFELFIHPRNRYDGYERQDAGTWLLSASTSWRLNEGRILGLGVETRRHTIRYFNLFELYSSPDAAGEIALADAYGYEAAVSGDRIRLRKVDAGRDAAPHPSETGFFASYDFLSEYYSTSVGVRYDIFDLDQRLLDVHDLSDGPALRHPKPKAIPGYRVRGMAHTPPLFQDLAVLNGWISYEKFSQAPPYQSLYVGNAYLTEVIRSSLDARDLSPANPMETRQFEVGARVGAFESYVSGLYYDRRQTSAVGYNLSSFISFSRPQDQLIYSPSDRKTTGWEFTATTRFHSILSITSSMAWMKSEETIKSTYHAPWIGVDDYSVDVSPRWQRDRIVLCDATMTASKSNKLLKNTAWVESVILGISYRGKTGVRYTPVFPEKMDYYGHSDGKLVARPNSDESSSSSVMDIRLAARKKFRGTLQLQVILDVLNIWNARNVEDVYGATGSANDDGYLESGSGQLEAAQYGPRFVQQYRIREKNGFMYGSPRQVRLSFGLQF